MVHRPDLLLEDLYEEQNMPENDPTPLEPTTIPWWQSGVLWTGLAQIVIGMAVTFGLIDKDSAARYMGMAPEAIASVLATVVGFMTVWFRIKANVQPLTLTK